jgi:hypothetical protein
MSSSGLRWADDDDDLGIIGDNKKTRIIPRHLQLIRNNDKGQRGAEQVAL